MKITYSSNNDICDYHIQTKRVNVYGVGSASGYLYRTATAMVNGLSPSIVFAVNARDTVNKFNDAIGAHLSSYALPTISLGSPKIPIAISWTPHFGFLWENWYENFPTRNTHYTQAVSETHHPNTITYVRERFYLDVMSIIKAPFNIDPAKFMHCDGSFSYTLQAGSDHGDWDWYPIGN
jgi:hypothetical protein